MTDIDAPPGPLIAERRVGDTGACSRAADDRGLREQRRGWIEVEATEDRPAAANRCAGCAAAERVAGGQRRLVDLPVPLIARRLPHPHLHVDLVAKCVEHADGAVGEGAAVRRHGARVGTEAANQRADAIRVSGIEDARRRVQVAGHRHGARGTRRDFLTERQHDVGDGIIQNAVLRHATLDDETVRRRDHPAFRVELEVARARVIRLGAFAHDEERVALHGEVGADAGGFHVALREELVDRADLRTESDLHRVHAALISRRTAGAIQQLRKAFLERHSAALEGRPC